MKAEIEDVQRKSEMDVVRQRKQNKNLQEQTLAKQEEILDLLKEVKKNQEKIKKEINK